MVVVPQSMSYAKIATLSPEFGLYSSFVGYVSRMSPSAILSCPPPSLY